MQTTLTIDDDLAALLEEEQRRLGVSLKDAVNAALRRGLKKDESAVAPKVVTRPHDFGFVPDFDSTNFNHLATEMEDAELLERMRRNS